MLSKSVCLGHGIIKMWQSLTNDSWKFWFSNALTRLHSVSTECSYLWLYDTMWLCDMIMINVLIIFLFKPRCIILSLKIKYIHFQSCRRQLHVVFGSPKKLKISNFKMQTRTFVNNFVLISSIMKGCNGTACVHREVPKFEVYGRPQVFPHLSTEAVFAKASVFEYWQEQDHQELTKFSPCSLSLSLGCLTSRQQSFSKALI